LRIFKLRWLCVGDDLDAILILGDKLAQRFPRLNESHVVIIGDDRLALIFNFVDVYSGNCLLECRRNVEGIGCEFALVFSKGQQLPG